MKKGEPKTALLILGELKKKASERSEADDGADDDSGDGDMAIESAFEEMFTCGKRGDYAGGAKAAFELHELLCAKQAEDKEEDEEEY